MAEATYIIANLVLMKKRDIEVPSDVFSPAQQTATSECLLADSPLINEFVLRKLRLPWYFLGLRDITNSFPLSIRKVRETVKRLCEIASTSS